MNDQNAAISVQKVCFRYRPQNPLVLDRISIDIPAGAITALLGPNGSGKSTLLNLLLGLLAPEEGRILLFGRPSNEYKRRETSQIIGLVPQDEYVNFELSVLEYVLLGRAPFLDLLGMPQLEDRRLAHEAIVAAGIASLENRPVPNLSVGERQLATIARALTQEPAIMLLDEPTSHLDLSNARRILHVLHLLKQSGKTIILTTHDPNAAAAIADYVILLRSGQVLASGPTATVLSSTHLSSTYGVEVDVLQVRDRPLILAYPSSH